MTQMIELEATVIEFASGSKTVKFTLLHNLAKYGQDADRLLAEWLNATANATAQSFQHYINVNVPSAVCFTEREQTVHFFSKKTTTAAASF